MRKKIIVIGSGFGGLATAARLLAAGHEVEIFEKRDKLGGRAYVYEQDGFSFDGGRPSSPLPSFLMKFLPLPVKSVKTILA
ncbi:MAG: NAD(P)-binding protein [Deinococcales bacterium]